MGKRTLYVLLAALLMVGMTAGLADAKKKKKKKAPPVCAPYVPGELGADQPLVTLTDAATAEAPVIQTVSLDPSAANFLPTDPTTAFFNVQVDPAAAESGLYARMTFDTNRDYDLWLRYADGSAGASSHEFNTLFVGSTYPPGVPTNESHGNESTASSEGFVGIRSADCAGWTIEVQNWLGEGGDFDVELWLGEATIDPKPQGEEPR